MILLDFMGQRGLRLPRERYAEPAAVGRAAGRGPAGGGGRGLPAGGTGPRCSTTTCPSSAEGVPAVDLIDFDFPCFHRRCDDLSRNLGPQPRRHGRDVLKLLPTL